MRVPSVLCYGAGVDSTAMLVELVALGQPPDLVLTADTGAEKPETYDYLGMMHEWMAARGIRHEVVRYVTKRFKHHPPYGDLAGSLLTNGCLPSIAFGRHSCSAKYKAAPQEAFIKTARPRRRHGPPGTRSSGSSVTTPAHVTGSATPTPRRLDDPLFDNEYPLRVWGWDRAACEARIAAEGLPVPPKSSCVFCLAMKPEELRQVPAHWLRLIVLIEACAAPRLRTVEGLWRRSTKTRPGRMTDFIRAERLLPADEIDRIIADAPADLVRFQQAAGDIAIESRPTLESWLERFHSQHRSNAA